MLKHFFAFAILTHCVICRFTPEERQFQDGDARQNCTNNCHKECIECDEPKYCTDGVELKCGEAAQENHPDCPYSDVCVPITCFCPNKPECPIKCEKECNEDEILCRRGIGPDGCAQHDYCHPKGTGTHGLCPGWCPKECEDHEKQIQCPLPNEQVTGCSVAPICIPKQQNNQGNYCSSQPCPVYCVITEIKCDSVINYEECKEGDTCVPKGSSNTGALCPGTCPVECESFEVLCKGHKDCDTGCVASDECISKVKDANGGYCPDDSASHGCPVICCDDDVLCPVETNGIGCKEKKKCWPRSKDSTDNFCPEHSDCPTICEPNEVLCPIEGEEENGCDKPDVCLVQERSHTDELCPVQCPFECKEDEVLCSGHINDIGCKEQATCEKKARKQWGNAEGDLCPGVCPERCEHDEILCPSQLDPCDGCPTEQVCNKKHKNSNGEYCPDDSASHNCPKLCFETEVVGRSINDQVLCPVYENALGCKPEARCIGRSKDYEGEVCPSTSVCPVQCQSDELECSDGVDARRCKRESLCVPRGKDGDGNPCVGSCPSTCTAAQTFCTGSTLPNGCQGQGYCTETECIVSAAEAQRTGCTGGDSCCTTDNMCAEGEGDCDSDSDCQDGLTCGIDNCEKKSGQEWDDTDDCCYRA